MAKYRKDDRRSAVTVGAIEPELHELSLPQAPAIITASGGRASLDRNGPPATDNEIDQLYASLAAVTPASHPRTAKLLASGTRKVAQKVIEEAGEVALAAVKHNGREIVRESADLLYQLAVLWHRANIDPTDVWGEMRRRAESLGIAEKLPKSRA